MKKEILQTLSYADVFDYPLSASEVWRFLISQNAKRKTQNEIKKELTTNSFLVSRIMYHDGFYSLKGREEIFAIRKKRERWSQEKQKLAEKIAGILRKIPWVKMIGITGALAMKNSDKEDDIDLFIITSKNRLWLTRGLVVTFLRLTGLYRRPGKIKDKICPNMLLDEEHLEIPKNEQDLFSAHEVCQMRPVWDKDNTYFKFLQDNSWARRFLPNSLDIKILRYEDIKGKQEKNFLISQFLNFLENLAYKLQLLYMKSRKTSEITDPGRIRFHPKDAREWVLKDYKERLDKLEIK